MNEIARLGLAIDSSPVVAATTALDKFAAAGADPDVILAPESTQ